jgi:hypothetical protein
MGLGTTAPVLGLAFALIDSAIHAVPAGLADPVYAHGAALFPEAALALTLAFLDVVSDAGDAPPRCAWTLRAAT